MEMRHRQLSLITSLLFFTPQVWAAPSNTMSVTPVCTSGTTILCSDETTRNNNISTPYNSHTHTDIAAMTGVNTFTIGDNAAGNKDYCEDGAVDRCLRYNSTADLWTIQQGGTNYNQIVTFTGTAGVSAGQVLVANGTGSIVGITSGASGTLLRSSGAGVNPVWSTPTFPNSFAQGDIIYASAANVLTALGAGTSNQVLQTRGAGANPLWATVIPTLVSANGGTTTTTTSTSFVDMTDMTVTFTPSQVTDVLTVFTCHAQNSGANTVSFQLVVDGAAVTTSERDIVISAASAGQSVTISYVSTSLSAAAHTIKVQWLASAGTNQSTNGWRNLSVLVLRP